MTMVLERTGKVAPQRGGNRSLDMSVADLDTAVRGMSFPATKHDLILQGRSNRASEDVMAFLHLLPEDRYSSFQDIAFMAWSFLLV